MVLSRGMRAQRPAPRTFTGVLLAASLLCVAPPAWAGGFASPEIGVRRTAMGAVIGRPDEPAAVYHNPAGITLLEGTNLYVSFGVAALQSKMALRPWEGSDRFITQPVDAAGYYPSASPKLALGIIPMIVGTTTLFRDRLFGALSFYVPNGIGSMLSEDGVTRYHLVTGYLVTGLWSGTLAWKPFPWLSVGAGVGAMYVLIYGRRYVYPIFNGEDYSNFLGSKTELTMKGSDVAPSWTCGLLVRPDRRVSIGATLIGRTDVTLEGPVNVTLGDDAMMQTTLKGSQRTAMIIPWTLLAGANFDVARNVEVGWEFRYYFYHQYKSQHSDITDIEIITELDTPKNYGDSWQLAGGVRVHSLPRLPGLELMAGGHYDITPAPPQTVSLDQPTFTHYGFRFGARYTFRDKYRLGFSYVRYWYEVPTTEGSLTNPPSNFRGSGGNNILTVSFEATLGRGLGHWLR